MTRTPSPTQSLQCLVELLPREIGTVVDIGVQAGTPFLYRSFPHAHHILYEPVSSYSNTIHEKYTKMVRSYELKTMALSDAPGQLKLHLLSSDRSGSVTHSQIHYEDRSSQYGDRLIAIEDIQVTTLDIDLGALSDGYLIKIDVDGVEDMIIDGGKAVVRGADVIIIEAHLREINNRLTAIQDLGFTLQDIVGNAYYYNQLQQVDLIFVRSDIVNSTPALNPWRNGPIKWMKWSHYDA
jgi:FkbM family methyltransferase